MKRINKDDQPDLATKLRTLEGDDLGWDYFFNVPATSHWQWSQQDWVTYIGDNWFRKDAK
jgi:hypothetical protein